jgi:hypothetical protein
MPENSTGGSALAPKQLRIVLSVSLWLCGCAGFKEAVTTADQYARTPVMRYMNVSGAWRIYDKATEGRLKVAPSLAQSFSAVFGKTITFGDLPKAEYEDAAEGWLASSGRMCRITDGTLLVHPDWEFKYLCR